MPRHEQDNHELNAQRYYDAETWCRDCQDHQITIERICMEIFQDFEEMMYIDGDADEVNDIICRNLDATTNLGD